MARQLSQILRWFGGPKRWFILAAGDGLLVNWITEDADRNRRPRRGALGPKPGV